MKNVNYFADFETSYINRNQLNLPNQERERYVYLACLKKENESDDINSQENVEVFADGKNTLKNFIDRIKYLSEEHYINKEQMVIHFQNLKYDWSYIVYYINVILNASNRGKTNGLSYTTIEDGVNSYSATIYINGGVIKQKVRREKRKSNIPSSEVCEKYNIRMKQQKDYTEISFPKYYSDGEKIRDHKIKSKMSIKTKKEKINMEKTLKIEGMMCGHCEMHVKKALEAIDGVKKAEVSHTNATAVLTLEKEVSDDVLKEAVANQGYKVTDIK